MSITKNALIAAATSSLILASLAPGAAHSETDKSGYHLFNPTPASEMREFVTDRPDRTESPITVDAGHFQIETDLVNLTRTAGQTSIIYNFMNVKAGVTNNSDLQFIIPSLVQRGDVSGFGNTTIRYKVNVFGNDGGPAAIGIMPYITLPTQSSAFGEARAEGGVFVPFGFDAPNGYSIGAMFQYDRLRNDTDNGFHSQLISSFTVSRGLLWSLEGYLEFFSQAEAGADWVATVDGGVILPINEQLRLDLGANVGVTEAADDFNPFLGLSARF